MNYMFEDFNSLTNLVTHPEHFMISPMVSRITRFNNDPLSLIHHNNENYIIPIGVRGHPDGWCGQIHNFNMFKLLNEQYIKDLREGRAILLLDNSHEEYHPKWLFNFFHDSHEMMKLPAECLVYLTGNAIVERLYEEWCEERSVSNKIKCLTFAIFEEEIFCNHQKVYTPSILDHLEYKNKNYTWSFNCLQKRPRGHREQFFDLLCDNDLVTKGLCSYPDRDVWIHGEVHDDSNYGSYVSRLHPEYCLQTFVTVVSEPQYFSFENSVFNSEKVFKPIACNHPFIVLGGKGSLASLKKRGYRTFRNYFDESYDDIDDDEERMHAIIDVLKHIESIEDKNAWFESMRGVLTFNYDTFVKNSLKPDNAMVAVEEYYGGYFNE